MYWSTVTSGLSSCAQLDYNSTSGEYLPGYEIIDVDELLEKSKKAELIKIRLNPEYNEIGFYVLLRSSNFLQCLPDNIYILSKADLKLLEDAYIPYQVVDLSASV
ncbi:MAG TPA: hypothetical protein EYP21_04345 [Syntrophaceae bacterium]|nr:hypothetical protein [Syntrophaceae bacterium]